MHAYIRYTLTVLLGCTAIYACTCKKRDLHLQFHIKSVIMHRFQSFLVFWKAESQLFHLKTSRSKRELVFLSEKQHLRKNHDFFTKRPSRHYAKYQYFQLKYWNSVNEENAFSSNLYNLHSHQRKTQSEQNWWWELQTNTIPWKC